jgi:hypothetical protein
MSKLGKYVSTLGVENFDDGEAKPEIVENDCEATLTEVKGELVEAEIKVELATDSAQALSEESAALEDYLDLLREAAVTGKMTPRAHQILTVGIESFTRNTGVVPTNFPTAADFGGRMSQRQAISISVESLSEVAKKTWEAFKLAVQALYGQLQDYAAKLLDGSAKLNEKALAMQATIKGMTGTPKVTEITIANGTPLAIDGQFAGQDVTALFSMTSLVFEKYQHGLGAYLGDIKGVIDSIKFDAPVDAIELGVAAFRHAPSYTFNIGTIATAVEGDSRFPAGAKVKQGHILPGNTAIYMTVDPEEKPNDSKALALMLTGVKLSLLPVPTAKPLQGEVTVKVGNLQELTKRITFIVRAAEIISKKQDYADSSKKALDALMTSLDHLKQRGDAAKEPAEGAPAPAVDVSATVSDFVGVAQNCQRLIGKDLQGMYSYCIRTLGAYLALIEKEVAAYQAPAEEAAPATEPATA